MNKALILVTLLVLAVVVLAGTPFVGMVDVPFEALWGKCWTSMETMAVIWYNAKKPAGRTPQPMIDEKGGI